jgi:hypothetical protein
VQLYGQLILLLETDHKFSVWYIEGQFKVCITLWQFQMHETIYYSMHIDEQSGLLSLTTETYY